MHLSCYNRKKFLQNFTKKNKKKTKKTYVHIDVKFIFFFNIFMLKTSKMTTFKSYLKIGFRA